MDEDHAFSSGDWLVLPSQTTKKAKQLAAIDTSELGAPHRWLPRRNRRNLPASASVTAWPNSPVATTSASVS